MQVVERNSSCPDGESCPDPVSAALGGIGQVGEDTSGHYRHPRHLEAATTPPRAAPHPLLFSPTQPRLSSFLSPSQKSNLFLPRVIILALPISNPSRCLLPSRRKLLFLYLDMRLPRLGWIFLLGFLIAPHCNGQANQFSTASLPSSPTVSRYEIR